MPVADAELRALLRRLALPIYLPTTVFGIGAAAIVPVLPLVGLQLGMSVPQVALLVAIAGLVSVVGPLPVGRLVSRIGERAALIAGGLLSITSVAACLLAAMRTDATPGVWAGVFSLAILLMSLGDLTWDLGRQTWIADEVPFQYRARAMTLFGGTMRVGRIIGPLLGAGAIAVGGMAAAFAVHLVAAIIALGLIIAFIPPASIRMQRSSAGEGRPPTSRREVLIPLLLVGVAPLILSAVRTNRDLLLPLLGNAYGHSESVVALVFAGAAVIELAIIVPAGVLMDRYGRAAVLVPCLVICGVGYLLAPLAATVGGFLAIAVVFAIGNGLGSGIVKTLSADLTPPENRASWLGVYNSYVGTGSLIGPALVTAASGVVAASFLTGGLAFVGAAWAAWWVPRLIPRRRPEESEPHADPLP